MPITIESVDDLLLMIGAKEAKIMVLRKAEARLQDRIKNLEQALANGSSVISAVNGAALRGNGARRMTDLCRSCGLEWSVQDGELQLLNIGQALSTTLAIQLDSTTGLIGSPSVDSQGALSLTCLLIPGLAPGVLLNVHSEFVKGGYRIEKIRYEGNTAGQEWYAHITCVAY